MSGNDVRPPVPPFTAETALKKVKAAQDLWNTKDPEKVILAYTVRAHVYYVLRSHQLTRCTLQPDTVWRNRDQFMTGYDEVKQFLQKKWEKENGYRLRKDLFAFTDNKIAVQVCMTLV